MKITVGLFVVRVDAQVLELGALAALLASSVSASAAERVLSASAAERVPAVERVLAVPVPVPSVVQPLPGNPQRSEPQPRQGMRTAVVLDPPRGGR